jgi:hypothetical protein
MRDFGFSILDFGLSASTRRTRIQNPKSKIQNRFGATLTEVLMSLLIMSVGVVSVFTLFPLSILRSINANQQTNGKILKRDAEELILSSPSVLYASSPVTGAPATPRFRGQWSPGTPYSFGDVVLPSIKPGSPFPSPNRWFQCVSAVPAPILSGRGEPAWNVAGLTIDIREAEDLDGDGTLDLNEDLNSNGALDPGPDPNGNGVDDALVWAPLAATQLTDFGTPVFPVDATTTDPVVSTQHYVVDPLGWNIYQTEMSLLDTVGTPAGFHEFGNKTNRMTGTGASLWVPGNATSAPILRINGSLNSEALALDNTTLVDTWETVVEATPLSITNAVPAGPTLGAVTFPPTVDLTSIGGIRRVVLTSTDGAISATRDITSINTAAGIVNWAAQFPLPARFPVDAAGNPDVGMARIENFDRRFTWFLTVRKDAAGNSETKVVVVFKRAFAPPEEHIYYANFGNAEVDVDNDGLRDNIQTDQVLLAWNWAAPIAAWNPEGAPTPPGLEPHPILKPGNFLFDVRDFRWYRIREVVTTSQSTVSGVRSTALLTLDRTVSTVTPPIVPFATGPVAPAPVGRAILMRGIVDVFEL